MGYLDRIAACNRRDLGRFVPFEVAGQRVGCVRRDRLPLLAAVPGDLLVEPAVVRLDPRLPDFTARTEALGRVTDELRARGELSSWRGEHYAVLGSCGQPPLAGIERAAVPWFGILGVGVHLNGWVRGGDGGTRMWIARRARDKPTAPGKLDNLVAGGQPVGMTIRDNLLKECAEEAAIPAELAARAVPVGYVSYGFETEAGLKRDVLYCYDLELPASFGPRNTDGEVESFALHDIGEVAAIVRERDEFKRNCDLVVIDYLVRHGHLAPDDADYATIVAGLRSAPL